MKIQLSTASIEGSIRERAAQPTIQLMYVAAQRNVASEPLLLSCLSGCTCTGRRIDPGGGARAAGGGPPPVSVEERGRRGREKRRLAAAPPRWQYAEYAVGASSECLLALSVPPCTECKTQLALLELKVRMEHETTHTSTVAVRIEL